MWEANHVWLIYVLVFMWTAFPTAFVAIMTTLFIPWMLVALGIVLRGGAFAFRKFSTSYDEAQAPRHRVRRIVGDHAVLPRHDRRSDRERPRPHRRNGRRLDQLDRTHLLGRWHPRRAHVLVPRRHVPRCRCGTERTHRARREGRAPRPVGRRGDRRRGHRRGGHPRTRRRVTRERTARSRPAADHHLGCGRGVQPLAALRRALGSSARSAPSSPLRRS